MRNVTFGPTLGFIYVQGSHPSMSVTNTRRDFDKHSLRWNTKHLLPTLAATPHLLQAMPPDKVNSTKTDPEVVFGILSNTPHALQSGIPRPIQPFSCFCAQFKSWVGGHATAKIYWLQMNSSLMLPKFDIPASDAQKLFKNLFFKITN